MSNDVKRYQLIAIIYSRPESVIGYQVGLRILDVVNEKVSDIDWKTALKLEMNSGVIANFTVNHLSITCNDGLFTELPKIYKDKSGNWNCFEKDRVIVLNEVVQNGSHQVLGYRVTDYTGVVYEFSLNELLSYQNVGFHNARIVDKGGTTKVVKFLNSSDFERIYVG